MHDRIQGTSINLCDIRAQFFKSAQNSRVNAGNSFVVHTNYRGEMIGKSFIELGKIVAHFDAEGNYLGATRGNGFTVQHLHDVQGSEGGPFTDAEIKRLSSIDLSP